MGSMREKLESLNLATLKDLAKHRGVKGSSTMKKAVLIEALLTAGGSADGRLGRLAVQEAAVEQVDVDAKIPGGGDQLGQVTQPG